MQFRYGQQTALICIPALLAIWIAYFIAGSYERGDYSQKVHEPVYTGTSLEQKLDLEAQPIKDAIFLFCESSNRLPSQEEFEVMIGSNHIKPPSWGDHKWVFSSAKSVNPLDYEICVFLEPGTRSNFYRYSSSSKSWDSAWM